MKSRIWLVGLAGLGVAAACSETTMAPVDQESPRYVPSAALSYESQAFDVDANVLEEADWAPSLDTYEAQFWAVAGSDHTFRIRYRIPADDDTRTFWRLKLDRETLLARPDGTLLTAGDSVLITVSVDPNRLVVDMEPSGLQFNPRDPAELTLYYGFANPDLNRDGRVDGKDDEIETKDLGVWFRADRQSAWEPVAANHDLSSKRFRLSIKHFSGYTVSW